MVNNEIKNEQQEANNSYEQLLLLTQSLLQLAEENEWDDFLEVELKRRRLIKHLETKQEPPAQTSQPLIETIQSLNNQLLTAVSKYQSTTKNTLIKFKQSSKKINNFYKS